MLKEPTELCDASVTDNWGAAKRAPNDGLVPVLPTLRDPPIKRHVYRLA